jgi:hypothetical protein
MKTGVSSSDNTPSRTADMICSSVGEPSRMASMSSSENIETASSIFSRAAAASASSSLGIGFSTTSVPSSPSK